MTLILTLNQPFELALITAWISFQVDIDLNLDLHIGFDIINPDFDITIPLPLTFDIQL